MGAGYLIGVQEMGLTDPTTGQAARADDLVQIDPVHLRSSRYEEFLARHYEAQREGPGGRTVEGGPATAGDDDLV